MLLQQRETMQRVTSTSAHTQAPVAQKTTYSKHDLPSPPPPYWFNTFSEARKTSAANFQI